MVLQHRRQTPAIDGDDDDFSFARGHREQRIDYHYRAIHETAVRRQSASFVRVLWAAAEVLVFQRLLGWRSSGARWRRSVIQPTTMACWFAVQRYTEPTASAAWTWVAQAVAAEPGSEIPPRSYSMIHDAVIGSCDALDGLQDGLVSRADEVPIRSGFTAVQGSRFGTLPDAGPGRDTQTVLFRASKLERRRLSRQGFLPGAETDPVGAISCRNCKASALHRASIFLDGLFDARFNVNTFDFDRDLQCSRTDRGCDTDQHDRPESEGVQGSRRQIVHRARLERRRRSGAALGEVLRNRRLHDGAEGRRSILPLVHGSRRVPQRVTRTRPDGFPGPMLKALEDWVENSTVPEAVIATNYKIDGDPDSGVTRTRPLCPYPQVATYKGTGSANDATNFACKTPSKQGK